MNKNPKLELTWIGNDEQPRLKPRILIEDTERSYPLSPPYEKTKMGGTFILSGEKKRGEGNGKKDGYIFKG
ncbi:MAG: hypothetical protein M1443_07650 [Nitrospirae bacterium]|nr:hypothetical protein [Nitrospirota bacterium]